MLNKCDLQLKSAQYRKALLRLIKACGVGHTGGGLSCLDILNGGSAKLAPFAKAAPGRIVEVGIAEQNPVGVAAGLTAAGKRVCAVTPASFLTAPSRSRFKIVGFPDEHTVTGSQEETFDSTALMLQGSLQSLVAFWQEHNANHTSSPNPTVQT